MLLCLSNIGDIMASSFRFVFRFFDNIETFQEIMFHFRNCSARFIYWRVCCFVCTREPKRRVRRPDFQRSISQPQQSRFSNRVSMRRSVRVSQRTADSGVDTFYGSKLSHAHSDTELRYLYFDRSLKRLAS